MALREFNSCYLKKLTAPFVSRYWKIFIWSQCPVVKSFSDFCFYSHFAVVFVAISVFIIVALLSLYFLIFSFLYSLCCCTTFYCFFYIIVLLTDFAFYGTKTFDAATKNDPLFILFAAFTTAYFDSVLFSKSYLDKTLSTI